MEDKPILHGSWMLLIGVILVLTNTLYAQDFVYTNNNVQQAANTVSAFSVAANGALTPIDGSPFATGGIGGGGGLHAANWITTCVPNNFLYAPNAGSSSVSGFSINPATGVLTQAPGSPFPVAGGPSKAGMSVACTPNGQFLMVGNGDARLITVFSIASSGALTPIAGSPFPTSWIPDGMKVSPDNKFLAVAELGPLEIFSIASNGRLTSVPGSPFVGRGGGNLASVDITCATNLLFGGEAKNFSGDTIVDAFSIAATGALTSVPGSPFIFPASDAGNSNVILLSPNDQLLFVSNVFRDSIAVFNVAWGGSLTAVSGSPFPAAGLAGMATNRSGSFLYAASSQSVYGYSIGSGGALAPVPGSPFPIGDIPSTVQFLTVFPPKVCDTQSVNDKVNFVVQSTSLNSTPVPGGSAGVFTITARLVNVSPQNILAPVKAVVNRLTNGNVVLSATEGSGGAGSKQALNVGVDGILTPNESVTVQFRIGLANLSQFTFLVDVVGAR